MEYSQLKEKYKFLGEILKFYDTLEEPVPANYLYQPILNLCDTGSLLQGDNAEKYIKFCKKISRNLLLLADLDYRGDIFIKYCGILYMWMYFEIIKNSIPNNIPEKIFYKLIEIIKDKLKKTPCPYINFNEKHHKPTKLIKLHIFNDNAGTFQSMLKDVRKSDDCSLKRYIYKCIEIYRDMHSTYCSNGDDKIEGNKNSCEIINKFNRLYSSYINKKNGILHEFPELSSNTPLNVIVGCPLEESESNPIPDKSQQGTPITRGVSTALSSMVGIPPFLVLIYKFTPVRNLFRFGNKKHTIITSDFDKKMENELFHVINEDSNIKDIQPKYNIGYEAT